MVSSQITHQQVQTNGITLHTVQAGPDDGPLVILLHGFPEFWYGWRHQIDFLVNAGYYVIVPDQRGYNLSDKPSGVAAYNLDELAADVIGLIDDAKRERASLIGHDWGAAVAWWAASKYADRLDKLVILNVPHPIVMQRTLQRSLAQLRKSWYMFFFQIPRLPEALYSRNNWRSVTRAIQSSARPGTFIDEDMAQYCQAWSQPGAMTAMINWYRAMFQARPKSLMDVRIHVPTLMIWGAQDQFLGREMAQPSIDLCDEGRLEFIETATHWIQHEEPERVNQLIGAFLAER